MYRLVTMPQTLEPASPVIGWMSLVHRSRDGFSGYGWETEERLCWIILSYSLNDCWSVGTTEDLQLIITGEDEIINKIPCNKFFKWECMFYLQYWPILGFKSMNENKHAFLSNRQKKKYSIAFLSLPAKEDMRSELQRGRQTQALSARRIRTRFALQRKI